MIACVYAPTAVDGRFPSARVHFVVLALQLHLRVFPAVTQPPHPSDESVTRALAAMGRGGNAQIGERNADRDRF